jgi:hypothetical protein
MKSGLLVRTPHGISVSIESGHEFTRSRRDEAHVIHVQCARARSVTLRRPQPAHYPSWRPHARFRVVPAGD